MPIVWTPELLGAGPAVGLYSFDYYTVITFTRQYIAIAGGRYRIGLRNLSMNVLTGVNSTATRAIAYTMLRHEYLFAWLRNKISTGNPLIAGWQLGPWSVNFAAAFLFVMFQGDN